MRTVALCVSPSRQTLVMALNRARHQTRRALADVLNLREELDTVYAAAERHTIGDKTATVGAIGALLCERRGKLTALESSNKETTAVALAGLMSLERWDALERKAHELRRMVHPIAEQVYALVITAKRVVDRLEACLEQEDEAYLELALALGETARGAARQTVVRTLCEKPAAPRVFAPKTISL
jgi:hypothetical protein